MEIHDVLNAMQEGLDRMSAATATIERVADLMAHAGEAQKIVATAESERELELERKLEEAERQIAGLRAQGMQIADRASAARKTLPAATTQLLAKQGITTLDSVEAGAVDAALSGLSLEQRIAVKAQLLRAGVLR
jgi:hypothetical protein